tara:strand:- start:878 stop:1675 length:798 start_codon:yes stop_codon:yes gene_type:complete
MTNITGWGRGTWGQGAWNQPLGVDVTGVSATGSIGAVVGGTLQVGVTGVSGAVNLSAFSSTTITFTVTVVGGNPSNHPYYNVGSSNKYAINGSTATADVALTLVEGNTYRFDQSDSSNSGHPLRFSETANGTHGGGSQYTDGVTTNGTPGNAGAYTEITVPVGGPDLFYYCTNHSAMGWSAVTPSIFNVLTTVSFQFGVTGVSASGAIGNASAGKGDVISVTGVSATGFVGEESIGAWADVIVSQTPNWSQVSISQTPNWTQIAA